MSYISLLFSYGYERNIFYISKQSIGEFLPTFQILLINIILWTKKIKIGFYFGVL